MRARRKKRRRKVLSMPQQQEPTVDLHTYTLRYRAGEISFEEYVSYAVKIWELEQEQKEKAVSAPVTDPAKESMQNREDGQTMEGSQKLQRDDPEVNLEAILHKMEQKEIARLRERDARRQNINSRLLKELADARQQERLKSAQYESMRSALFDQYQAALADGRRKSLFIALMFIFWILSFCMTSGL